MIRLLGKIPKKFIIACSGGVDSMVMVDFFLRGNKDFELIFVHHNTKNSDEGLKIVQQWSKRNNRIVHSRTISTKFTQGKSREEYWRDERYSIFSEFKDPIFTAHHLNDVMETWIFTSLNGNSFTIPYHNEKFNVFRPFLLNPKKELYKWAKEHDVPFVEDSSNEDLEFRRNRIRHCIVPECLKVNPGLEKVLRKKVLVEYNEKFGQNG